MLRASRAVSVTGSGLLGRYTTPVGQIRSVSTQLIRERERKRKNLSSAKNKYNRLKNALKSEDELVADRAARDESGPRRRSKYGKLAGKLAEIKAKTGGDSSSTSSSLTPEQREVLELIQSPVVSTHRGLSNPRVLSQTLGPEKQTSQSDAESTFFDHISGRYIDRSLLEHLPSLDGDQLSAAKSKRVDPIHGKAGNDLVRAVNGMLTKQKRGPFMFQELNLGARFEAHERLLLQTVLEELQHEIEREKIYQERLQGWHEGSFSYEEKKEYLALKEAHEKSFERVEELAERFATISEEGRFIRNQIEEQTFTDGSGFVHVVDVRSKSGKVVRKRFSEFSEQRDPAKLLPQATITDGVRCYAKYGPVIVVFPFYKLSGAKLVELLEKREKRDKDTGEPADELSYSVFQLPDAEKDRYYRSRKMAPVEVAETTSSDLLTQPAQQAGYQDVVEHLESLRPQGQILPSEQWAKIASEIDANVLTSDLRTYVRDQVWNRGTAFSKLTKAELIELLREEVWNVRLTDSLGANVAVASTTLTLTDMQKQLLFRFHPALVQLWVSRGADVNFAKDSSDKLVVTARENVLEMVQVTLTQFGRKISSAELRVPKSVLKQLSPEHWKSLEKATKTQIVREDGTVTVYHVGDAQTQCTLLKQYIDNMHPGDRFSQQVIYQTDSESVSKSAYFARTVTAELPWYKRVIPKWARWREIHSLDSVINTQQPELSLVSKDGVTRLPADQSLQTIIADTLMAQLEAIPSQVITQDAEKVLEEDYDGLSEKLANTARENGIVATYDPAANNIAPTAYEKVSITATLGHLVHANQTSRDSRAQLALKNIDPVNDVHFSGSVPYISERIQKLVPKPQVGALKRYRLVVDCVPVSADAPSVQIESVNLDPNEKLWFRYPPVRLYATTRQANLLVSLPSVNSDLRFSAMSRQKLLPTKDFYSAWKQFWTNKSQQQQNVFVFNINGEDVEYKIRNMNYSRYDEYHVKTAFERFSESEGTEQRQGGVMVNRVTNGGDLNGAQNEVSVQTIWRDYKIDGEEEQKEQLVSDGLLEDFVGNSLKFMDSLDSESIPL